MTARIAKKLGAPARIVHGDDDPIVAIHASTLKAARPVPSATLKLYQGAVRGLAWPRAGECNADALAFLKR